MPLIKLFFCSSCGERLDDKTKICGSCGFRAREANPYGEQPVLGAGGVGWSERIDDPRFAKYQKNNRSYMFIFAAVIAVLVPGILLATGELDWDSEGKLVVGVIVGLYFLSALIMSLKTIRKGKEWEGVVEDKKYSQRERCGGIYVRQADGKLRELKYSNDRTLYDYYKVGDKLRFHFKKNLRAIEKYDKSRDEILFCVSCASMCDARADYCAACGCPLLKGQQAQITN